MRRLVVLALLPTFLQCSLGSQQAVDVDVVKPTARQALDVQTRCEVPAPGNNPDAMNTGIQAALDRTDCDLIELEAGTYAELLTVRRAVVMRGRGAGRTILSGAVANGGGTVITVTSTGDATLSDLTIQDGRAPDGGGVKNNGGRVTLRRCHVTNNAATAPTGQGGGLFNAVGGAMLVEECVITRNTAGGSGGGIANSGVGTTFVNAGAASLGRALSGLRGIQIPSKLPEITFSNTIELLETAFDELEDQLSEADLELSDFDPSTAVNAINTLFMQSGSSMPLTKPSGNDTPNILQLGTATMIINRSTIEHNTVASAVVFGGGVHSDLGLLYVEDSNIQDNHANGNVVAGGGGVSAMMSVVTMRGSRVLRNEATVTLGSVKGPMAEGGGIFAMASKIDVGESHIGNNSVAALWKANGGGVSVNAKSNAVFTRCSIFENQAGAGGGLSSATGSTLNIKQSEIRANTAQHQIGAQGGGIRNDTGSSLFLDGVTLNDNIAVGTAKGGAIFNKGKRKRKKDPSVQAPLPAQYIELWDSSPVSVTNSTFSGNRAAGQALMITVPGPCPSGYGCSSYPVPYNLKGSGGAIYARAVDLARADVNLRNVTFFNNESLGAGATGGTLVANSKFGYGFGGVKLPGRSARITVDDSLIFGRVGGAPANDCVVEQTDGISAFILGAGRNFDSDGTCAVLAPANIVTVTSALPVNATLASNGGFTRTHAIFFGGAANNTAVRCLATDQRGAPRVSPCDVGAYELSTPVSVADSFHGREGEELTIPPNGVLANDIGEQLTVTLGSGPTHGTLTLLADGSFRYVPNNAFSGDDSFTYSATGTGGTTGAAVVTLHIAPLLHVVSVSPARNSIGLISRNRDVPVRIGFDHAVPVGGWAGALGLVRSRTTAHPAQHPSGFSVSPGSTNTMFTLIPSEDFAAGEVITAFASSAIVDGRGAHLET